MKNSRHLAVLENVVVIGKVQAETTSAQAIEMPASGLTSLLQTGRKCDHGVYIPANSTYPDNAEFCTLCNPYMIRVKEHGIYTA